MSHNVDDRILGVQMMVIFDNILEDLRTSDIKKPRIYSVMHFTEINTSLIVYDKFCAILEVNKDKLEYVALGRNDAETLSHGLLELVDIRVLSDDLRFKKGVHAFKAYVDTQPPQFQRDIPDIKTHEAIIGAILDTWKLAHEIEMAGGFH